MRPFISPSSDSFLKDSMSFWCFVFFRCLIYKVQARPPSRTGQCFILALPASLVKPFFHLPQNFFCFQLRALIQTPALANFVILPRPMSFVKRFFQFLETFLTFWSWLPAPLGERSTIIANTPLVVNPFFQVFSTFSKFPILPRFPSSTCTTAPPVLP